MKLGKHVLSLVRSPLKTALTLLLLAAAAFLFLYNLSEYSVADREYREARDKYEGVLTVEEQPMTDNSSVFDLFLLTDETGRTRQYGEPFNDSLDLNLIYEEQHQQSLGEDLIETLSVLPHVSRVERRYLTAGVSPDYVRLDKDQIFFPYDYRCVIEATVKYRYTSNLLPSYHATRPFTDTVENLILEDVELLAGDPAWLWNILTKQDYEQVNVFFYTRLEEYRDVFYYDFELDYAKRCCMLNLDNYLYSGEADFVRPGGRYVFVLRNYIYTRQTSPQVEEKGMYPDDYFKTFYLGDDTVADWWPYFTDVTGLPENWLEGEEYADLRELIQVTNEDVHTFDVVYCDDMAAQRRTAEQRIVCEEGRFLTPADAGQPVCVVNVDLLDACGLKVGDSITLDLGNYLSEQYAPLGAVASTRGRQNTEYTTQSFTIIGAWRDLNEGKHPFRDRYWCWSDNAIFVPTSFLPECRNAEGHEFKPSEVSFVVGNAEEIEAFVEECLPLVEAMGLTYQFSDNGWLLVARDLMRARGLALTKLLIFTGAAVFALVLTVWLFIGRKKREYGILRALGMGQGEASNRLLIPFLLLGLLSAVLGLLAARIVTGVQLAASETAHVSASIGLFLLGAAGFLVLLAVMAYAGILLIRRESILALTQEKQK